MTKNSRFSERFLFARFLSALLIVSIALPPSSVPIVVSLSNHQTLRTANPVESGQEEKLSRALQSSAGLEENPDEFPTERDPKFFEKLGEPRWGLQSNDWAGLWYLLNGKIPESLDDTMDELNRIIRSYQGWEKKNLLGEPDERLAGRLLHALYDWIRQQYGLDWAQWHSIFELTNENIPADPQRFSAILSGMISKGTRFDFNTPLTVPELMMVRSLRERIEQSEPLPILPIDPRIREFPTVATEKEVRTGYFTHFVIALTLLGVGWLYTHPAWNGAGVIQPNNAQAPVVARTRQPQSAPAELFRFKWQGEGPIAERDGERIDFNDWDKLGRALTPDQVDLFLREREGAESWLVPVDAALPINRAIHVFDQVGIPAQQLPQNLNYFNLSTTAATEVTPDLLEQGIRDGDILILRADQVTPEGAKNLIPEGIKARVVLLTPPMLKQITARQLLSVAGQLEPGETLWVQHLSYVTLESQRYLLIAA